jgi:3'(2'), 5'-bisphosphate nucleotidase
MARTPDRAGQSSAGPATAPDPAHQPPVGSTRTTTDDLGDELAAALAAVRAASAVCRGAQGQLLDGHTLTKGDASPVTIADFAAQAVVCAELTDSLGPIEMIGEEDSDDLRSPDASDLLDAVVGLVAAQRPDTATGDAVLDWISVGASAGGSDRYWTLDPIDGTKGFLRGEQYAIALALIERGEVILGVLGCPNLPNPDGSTGPIFAAAGAATNHACLAWYGPSTAVSPADLAGAATGSTPAPTTISVSAPAEVAEARFCEWVESGHSNQEQSALIAARLGITADPYRIDSQCKYAAVARGDASIYLRLPTRADYTEKIWDHAAGKFVVEQAGGVVTDITGAPLDFSHGAKLAANRGVIATDGRFHAEVVDAVHAVLG